MNLLATTDNDLNQPVVDGTRAVSNDNTIVRYPDSPVFIFHRPFNNQNGSLLSIAKSVSFILSQQFNTKIGLGIGSPLTGMEELRLATGSEARNIMDQSDDPSVVGLRSEFNTSDIYIVTADINPSGCRIYLNQYGDEAVHDNALYNHTKQYGILVYAVK